MRNGKKKLSNGEKDLALGLFVELGHAVATQRVWGHSTYVSEQMHGSTSFNCRLRHVAQLGI